MSIVQDDAMAGEPRIDGRRITVLQVVTAVESFGGVKAAAEQLRISVEEVEEALAYAEDHPEEIAAIRQERERLATDATSAKSSQ